MDVVDNLLEKTDACLDEYSGLITKSTISQEGQMTKTASVRGKQKLGKALRTHDIAKPQLLFDKVPNNQEISPFKPLLLKKPNAIVALDTSLKLIATENGSMQYV